MTRLLLALLVCAACKHSSSSSSTSHTETQTTTDSTSSETGTQTTVTTTSEAPGKTTTTVEEFAPPNMLEPISPDPALTPHGTDGGHSPPDGESGSLSAGHASHANVPRQGPLVKRTVTVTEHGEKDTTARQEASTQAQGATETKAAGKVDTTARAASESKPAASCIGASWLWGAAVLAGIVGVLYFAIKMRKSVV